MERSSTITTSISSMRLLAGAICRCDMSGKCSFHSSPTADLTVPRPIPTTAVPTYTRFIITQQKAIITLHHHTSSSLNKRLPVPGGQVFIPRHTATIHCTALFFSCLSTRQNASRTGGQAASHLTAHATQGGLLDGQASCDGTAMGRAVFRYHHFHILLQLGNTMGTHLYIATHNYKNTIGTGNTHTLFSFELYQSTVLTTS